MDAIEKVKDGLKEIVDNKGIRVVMALVSGSRAYGINTLMSDWDVKFVFVNPPESYVSVESQPEVIELPNWNGTDISYTGYELGKYLHLMRKSCTNQLEYLNTDYIIPEFTDNEALEIMRDLGTRSVRYNKIFHGLAGYSARYFNKMHKAETQDEKLKCAMHLARLNMTGKWYEHLMGLGEKRIAPARVQTLVDDISNDPVLLDKVGTDIIDFIFDAAARRSDIYLGDLEVPMQFVHKCFKVAQDTYSYLNILSNNLPQETKDDSIPDIDELNSFYRKIVFQKLV